MLLGWKLHWWSCAMVTLLGLSTTVACRSTSRGPISGLSDENEDQRRSREQKASERRMQRFRESQAPVVRTMINAPGQMGEDFRRSIELKEAEIFTNEKVSAEGIRGVRLALAALMKNEASREISFRASLEAIRRRSDVLKDYFLEFTSRSAASEPDAVYDVLIVGAGPSAAIQAQHLLSENPDLKILIIDARNKPGGTFADVNSGFFLNSTDRESVGERPTPGRGDLNYIAPLLGLPDFESIKWPVAGKLGRIVSTLLDVSSADALLQTELASLDETSRGYRLVDKVSGKAFRIRAKKLIFSTGLGDPNEIFVLDTVVSLKREREAKDQERKITGIDLPLSVEPFTVAAERIGLSETPLRPYINEPIAVYGPGDSAKVMLEFLFRMGPEEAYGRDVAQVGKVGPVYWFVPFETCEEFLNGSPDKDLRGVRSRYARIFGEISSGNIRLVEGRVLDAVEYEVTLANGQKRIERDIIYRTKDGQVLSSRTDGMRYADSKRSGPVSERMVYERATIPYSIAATGFSPTKLAALLQPLYPDKDLSDPEDLKSIFNVLEAPLPEYGNEIKKFALQAGNKEIFLSGPAADSVGLPLPEGRELAGVNANTVSLFANGPRERYFANRIAALIKEPTTYRSNRLKSRLAPASVLYNLTGSDIIFSKKVLTKPSQSADTREKEYLTTVNPELELRTEIDRIFSVAVIRPGTELQIEFALDEKGQIEMEVGPVSAPGFQGFETSQLNNTKRLYTILSQNYFGPGNRTERIKLAIPTFGQNSGRLNFNLATFTETRGRGRPYEAKPVVPVAERPPEPSLANPTITQREQIRILDDIKAQDPYIRRDSDPLPRFAWSTLKYLIIISDLELSPEQLLLWTTEPSVLISELDLLVVSDGKEDNRSAIKINSFKPEAGAIALERITQIWNECCAANASGDQRDMFYRKLADQAERYKNGTLQDFRDFVDLATALANADDVPIRRNLDRIYSLVDDLNAPNDPNRSVNLAPFAPCGGLQYRLERISLGF